MYKSDYKPCTYIAHNYKGIRYTYVDMLAHT